MNCADRLQEQLWFSASQVQPQIDKMPSSLEKNVSQRRLNRFARYMQHAIKNAQLPYPDQERLRLSSG